MNCKYVALVDSSLVALVKSDETRLVEALLGKEWPTGLSLYDGDWTDAVMQAELVDGVKPRFDIYKSTVRHGVELESGEEYATNMYILAVHNEMKYNPHTQRIAMLYRLTEAMAMAVQWEHIGTAATRAAQMATDHVNGWDVVEYALFYPDD